MRILRSRKQKAAGHPRRTSVLVELERRVRRLRLLPLATPLFLLAGFSVGEVTTRAIALSDYDPIGVASRTPHFQIESLGRLLGRVQTKGARTTDLVVTYTEHVAPVERVLAGRGVDPVVARRVAWPLVEHARRAQLDLPTVLSVVWIESGVRPRATSFVGARGLMQVMPAHAGRWRGCGTDLYDIEANLCNGTSILAWYIRRFDGDERRALLGYNGCVRGANTPDCGRYPMKVWRLREQFRRELAEAGRADNRPSPASAAAAP